MNADPSATKPSAREIFLRALGITTPEEREACLAGACGQDAALRSRVEALLRSHREDDFLEAPAREAPGNLIAVDAIATEAPGDRVGRYKLLEKIGEGGCGVVFMAEQEEPVRRKVALKIIKPGMDSRQVIARFEAERQALAMMDHPNIAKVFDGGVTGQRSGDRGQDSGVKSQNPDGADGTTPSPGPEPLIPDPRLLTPAPGRPYFVMELVRGIRITDYCEQHNLSTRQRLDLFIAVCSAIQHAHQKGVIHRDLKPSNVLVTENDGKPVPKVIDFGIAKATEQKLTDKTLFTQFAQFIGTPDYMSPEQAALTSLDIDTRSDIYSLGVLLYELLTGTTPFDAQELLKAGFDEMRRVIREAEPERPSTRLTALQGRRGERERGGGVLPVGRDSVEPKHSLGAGDGQPGHGGRALGLAASLAPLSSVAAGTDDSKVDQGSTESRPTGRGSAVVSNPQSAIGNRKSGIDPDLDWIVMKCLEKDRARRYETANGLAADLQRHMNNEPVVARPPSTAYRFQKLVRRNKTAFAAAVALLLVAALGVTGILVQLRRAERHRQLAELQSHRAEANAANERRERYYASITAADSHIRNGDIDLALSVLTNSPTELRHWEWGRLMYLCHQSISSIRLTNRDNFDAIIVNANGTRVVEAPFMLFAASRSVCRDARTGQELFEIASGGNSVVAMTFSLDGTRLAAALQSGLIRIWNVLSGEEPIGFSAPSHVHTLQFDPTASRLAVVMDSGRGLILNATNGQVLLTTPELGVEFRIGAVDPNGRFWVTMDEDGRVSVRDARTGSAQFHFQSDPAQNVLTYRKRPSLFLSPDGTRLAANASAQSARVWDLTTGREILFIPSRILGGAFQPNGTRIALFSGGKTAELWDLATGEKSPVIPTHQQRLNFVGFDESGARLRTASIDGTVRTWPALPGRERLNHPYFVDSVAFRPDGKRCVTTQQDGLARVWDTTTGQELLNFRGNWNWLRAASYSPDGKRIVTGGADRRVRIFEADTGRELLVLTGHTSAIRSAAFSPDGRKVATGSYDKTVRLWDAETGRELFTLRGHTDTVRRAAFTPDGGRLISVAHDSKVHVWETGTGRLLTTLAGGNRALAIGPDGRRAATGSHSGSIRLWDLANGELLEKWTARGAVEVLDFSPDGKRLLAVTGDVNGLLIAPTLEIWEVESGRQLLVLNEHSPVFSAKFSPDGQRILSGSLYARAARLWEAFPWEEQFYPDPPAAQFLDSKSKQASWPDRGSPDPQRIEHVDTARKLPTLSPSQRAAAQESRAPGTSATPLLERIQTYAAGYWGARLAAEEQARKLPPPSPPDPLRFPKSAWPPRDANAARRLLDLSSFYNVPLHACWEIILSEIDYDEDLSSLPTGIVTLGDVPFDVRGIIRLAIAPNSALDGSVFIPYPNVVEGIQVSANCQRIHMLHGADLTSLPDGTPIWRIVLCYVDGQRREIPVLFGRDVRWIWELDQDTTPADQGVVAWRGISPAVARRNGQQRLYRTTFNNPRPEVEVQSIDLVSALTQCVPLVIALTLEP